MKNWKILLVIAAVLLVAISGGTYYSLATDSGFDTSYGGGSSSSGGSSYSGSSSYDGGSSSSSGDGEFTELDAIIIFSIFSIVIFGVFFLISWKDLIKFKKEEILNLSKLLVVWTPIFILCLKFTFKTIISILFALIMIGIFVFAIVDAIRNKGKNKVSRKDTREALENTYRKLIKSSNNKIDLSSYISNFDKDKFIQDRYNDYIEIQESWMNFEYDKLRSKLTDELYNQYELQLNTLKMKNQKNVMRNFQFINSEIVGTKINDDLLTVRVLLETSFYDYITNNKNRIIRGTNKKKVVMLYSITYVCRLENNSNVCPHCGAEINNSASQVCEFCKGTISHISSDWVMSKKEAIKQIKG